MGNILDYRPITFFDVETTHLDPAKGEIIQIAILTEDSQGRLTEWSTRIKPQLKPGTYSSKALEINGYNEKDWADAPDFIDVADTIVEKLRWGPIVAHNSSFDIGFVESCLERYSPWRKSSAMGYKSRTVPEEKVFRLGYPVIDTVALSYLMIPTERQNLNSLREHLDITTDGAHEAVKDVHDCRSVFWHCVSNCIEILNK